MSSRRGESKTEARYPLLGGLIGAVLGYLAAFGLLRLGTEAVNTHNLLLEVLALPINFFNLVGWIVGPVYGFVLGSRFCFTTKRTQYK